MSDLAQNALAAKRVGQYLIDSGVLKREQLDEALDRQRRMSKAGFHVLLGTILEEMGAIDRQSLEAIILRQRLDEGSVNLGPEINWSPYRPTVEPPPAKANGHSTTDYSSESTAATPLAEHEPKEEQMFPQDVVDSTSGPSTYTAGAEAAPSSATFHPMEDAGFPSSAANWPQADAQASVAEPEVQPEQSWRERLPRFPFGGDRKVDAPAETNKESGELPPVEAAEFASTTDDLAPAETVAAVNADPAIVPGATAQTVDSLPAAAEDTAASAETVSPDAETNLPAEEKLPDASAVWTPTEGNSANSVESATATAEVTAPLSTDSVSPVVGTAQVESQSSVEEPPTAVVFQESPQFVSSETDNAGAAKKSEPREEEPLAQLPSTEDDQSLLSEGAVEVMGFRFSRRSSGLAETEVSAVISQLVKRTRNLEDQIAESKETLSHLDSMRRYGEQSIRAADTIAEEVRSEAEKQATAIRERAQLEARRIVSEARTQHDEILRAAGDRAQQVASEITSQIDEHRVINQRLIERAEELAQTNTAGQDA